MTASDWEWLEDPVSYFNLGSNGVDFRIDGFVDYDLQPSETFAQRQIIVEPIRCYQISENSEAHDINQRPWVAY